MPKNKRRDRDDHRQVENVSRLYHPKRHRYHMLTEVADLPPRHRPEGMLEELSRPLTVRAMRIMAKAPRVGATT